MKKNISNRPTSTSYFSCQSVVLFSFCLNFKIKKYRVVDFIHVIISTKSTHKLYKKKNTAGLAGSLSKTASQAATMMFFLLDSLHRS